MSGLARKVGVHTSTVSAAIHGERGTSSDVVAALARELGADVAGWLGREYHGPWEPPASSALLNDRQRKAIVEVINAMIERQEQGDEAKAAPIGGADQEDDPARTAERPPVKGRRARGRKATVVSREVSAPGQSEPPRTG